jgi:hypothetical protein
MFIRRLYKMKTLLLLGLVVIVGFRSYAQKGPSMKAPLLVRKCADFNITGKGDVPEWSKAEWNALNQLDPGVPGYDSRFKILYSAKGIYVLFNGKDQWITTTYDQDFEDLYNADVFEVFFHPDPKTPIYFEYEINQLNKELVLLIPSFGKQFTGWMPWHYEGDRKVQKQVYIEGGRQEKGASISAWSAELFIPFSLLATLSNVPPGSGTVWNANFYRLDYDTNKMIKWAWAPVEQSFHEYKKFGSIRFE